MGAEEGKELKSRLHRAVIWFFGSLLGIILHSLFYLVVAVPASYVWNLSVGSLLGIKIDIFEMTGLMLLVLLVKELRIFPWLKKP